MSHMRQQDLSKLQESKIMSNFIVVAEKGVEGGVLSFIIISCSTQRGLSF